MAWRRSKNRRPLFERLDAPGPGWAIRSRLTTHQWSGLDAVRQITEFYGAQMYVAQGHPRIPMLPPELPRPSSRLRLCPSSAKSRRSRRA